MEKNMNCKKLVLLEFGATWCEPCQLLGKELDEVRDEMKELVDIVRLDVDQEKELTAQMGVKTIPTLIVLDNGLAVNQAVGFMPKDAIIELIDKHV